MKKSEQFSLDKFENIAAEMLEKNREITGDNGNSTTLESEIRTISRLLERWLSNNLKKENNINKNVNN